METYKTQILSHDKVFLNSQDNNKRKSLYGRLKKKKKGNLIKMKVYTIFWRIILDGGLCVKYTTLRSDLH